jgi:cobalt-zinc-cadmium efflux system protein
MSSNHSHHNHHQLSGKNLFISIFLNILITTAQVIGGIISGSLALISDAIHNLSDVISLIISYIANLLTNSKKQTLDKTFGYKRAEIIAAFINATALIVIAVFLAIEAFHRFEDPQIIDSNLVIILAIIGILFNGLSVLLLRKDASHNLNMRSAYLHLLSDMLTSVAVFLGGLLMKYFQIYWVDAVLTILISIYLLVMSWNIFISSLKILMLFAPDHIKISEVVDELLKNEAVRNIHHIHIWQLNDHDCHFEAHVEFKENIKLSDFDTVCKEMETVLVEKFKINHCNFQPEYDRKESKEIIIQD